MDKRSFWISKQTPHFFCIVGIIIKLGLLKLVRSLRVKSLIFVIKWWNLVHLFFTTYWTILDVGHTFLRRCPECSLKLLQKSIFSVYSARGGAFPGKWTSSSCRASNYLQNECPIVGLKQRWGKVRNLSFLASNLTKGLIFSDNAMKLGILVPYNLLNDLRCGAHFPETMPQVKPLKHTRKTYLKNKFLSFIALGGTFKTKWTPLSCRASNYVQNDVS